MGWIPGWDSIASAGWWSGFFFWGSIISLIGLGISEVASHRYSERKDELVERQQLVEKKEHDDEIARLHLEAANATKEAARVSLESEQLKADNLSLQKVMIDRHVGVFGINGPAKAQEWFAGIEAFPNMTLVIQAADDPEAQNLAKEIATTVSMRGGWITQLINEKRSGLPTARISEGVHVLYPTGKSWSADEPTQPWFAWKDAAEILANALTKAGLGIADIPVPRSGFSPDPTNLASGGLRFDPPLTGVYLQIGPRPISLTIQWMESRRKAMEAARAFAR